MNQVGTWLLDGAMGTWYADRYGDDMPCELAVLRHPERIAAIHGEYLLAGADAVTTDTFRADPRALGIGMGEVLRILDAAWRTALGAAGTADRVWAGFGPPAPETPDGTDCAVPADAGRTIRDETARKIDRFLALGARRFLFETFDDDALPLWACARIKEACPEAVTLVSFAVSPDGTARSGRMGRDLYEAACLCPHVDIVGFNCVSGPVHLLRFIRTLRADGASPVKPLAIMPNAGYPVQDGGRTVYRNNPEYFAETLAAAPDLGAAVLGGCCGTTPAHIAALSGRLRARTAASAARPAVAAQAAAAAAPPMRNRFRERLRAGHPVLLAELDPPAGADPGMVPAFAAAYRDAGADIVTVADNPLGSARADVGVTAARVRRECGVDAMPHLACRDRNLLAIRSQLIALHNEGIRNLLAVTGDPVPADLAASARGVFHLNSVQLLDFIMNLNRSLFDGDGFHVGAALNLGAQRFEPELEKARRKVEAGAAFLITQPVFGGDGLRRLGEARDAGLGVPLIAGILPVVSHRNALFLNNEVHGIRIPDGMVEAFRDLPRDEAAALGVRYAVDTIRDAAGLADGFHLMTPFRRTEMVARILRETRAALPAYQ